MSAAKRNALGKGLGALIEDAGNTNKEIIEKNSAIDEIDIKFIETNPFLFLLISGSTKTLGAL